MSYHATDFDEGPLDEFMRERHCRTIIEGHGQTFDVIETPELVWEVLHGVAQHLATNDHYIAIEVSPTEVPADREGAIHWLRARGDLGQWHVVP